MVTSRDIISAAIAQYKRGRLNDDEFIRIVDPVTSKGGADALLRIMKRQHRPVDDPNVIDAAYRVIEPGQEEA